MTSGNANKLLVVASVSGIMIWLFVWGAGGGVGRVGEFAFVVVSCFVVHKLIGWLWPGSMAKTFSELLRYWVSLGWGVGIAVLFIMSDIVSDLWRPWEYIMMPIPAIVLSVVFLRLRRRRRENLV